MSPLFDGVKASMAAKYISGQLETYLEEHPLRSSYPAADLARLKKVARELALGLPAVAKGVERLVPRDLPPENALSAEAKTTAVRVAERLMDLIPQRFLGQLQDTRVKQQVDYEAARKHLDKVRDNLPLLPLVLDKLPAELLPDSLVRFAADNGIAPAELETFKSNLDRVVAMVPLVEAVHGDLAVKLGKVDELLAGARLAAGTAAA
ncbi:MAG: hypothetical protein HY903_07830 [Deltaproteobacteria bacterium]|nr:hypothetical protein [Deltaproteobacteria bacterium]